MGGNALFIFLTLEDQKKKKERKEKEVVVFAFSRAVLQERSSAARMGLTGVKCWDLRRSVPTKCYYGVKEAGFVIVVKRRLSPT